VRFIFRTGPGSAVSVGIIGGLVLLILLAATVFWVAVIVAAVTVLAALAYACRWAWLSLKR
jgi:hypothetical protein